MTGKLSAAQLAERLPDEANEGPTQLADRYPQIDAPLRVEPPPSFGPRADGSAPRQGRRRPGLRWRRLKRSACSMSD